MIKKLCAIVALALIISCSLDHSNPLDPENSGIEAPSEVTGIQVSFSAPNHVSISWNPKTYVDGYFLYRSFSEDGLYDLFVDLENSISSYSDETISQNYKIWYKVSAYIFIDEEENDYLEGYRSAPKTWNN
ncbi:MAG: hypothetical protein Q7J16_09020 [Candidatus Cloacimonadales bacterium]|nr:hypothetical protein [Candidatus Cloacimonadales bacterium]